MTNATFRYWGKARTGGDSRARDYHPLAYHSLDVAAVARCWLRRAPALLPAFSRSANIEPAVMEAWLLFFVALHDLGKWDFRFQLKAPDTALALDPLFAKADRGCAKDYDHGASGYVWLLHQLAAGGGDGGDVEPLERWARAVASHHGTLTSGAGFKGPGKRQADEALIAQDAAGRRDAVAAMQRLFLAPQRLDATDLPPVSTPMLAGFCSVCDWLGSNERYFPYQVPGLTWAEYFAVRCQSEEFASRALADSGLCGTPCDAGGMATLFPGFSPRGVQLLCRELPAAPGLTVIEAPTGSGKTEAALAYASHLLAAGLADSVVFALPTQATANAMLTRLERIAAKLFADGDSNIVLAHGKAAFNPLFRQLQRPAESTAQGAREAFSQCAGWLSQSRKRVFLGQIGVCTIDQVLLSVLPVRHSFVRLFGVAKSVLIVDEIHAYDSYMNGLLDEVLKKLREAGGSVILLSATLPSARRRQLLGMRDDAGPTKPLAYPLIGHAGAEGVRSWQAAPPAARSVHLELVPSPSVLPDSAVREDILRRANAGARVAIVCNLVADAQQLARDLRRTASTPVGLFHSRFRFVDRQQIEQSVLVDYGADAERHGGGRIIVATQVIEQSLDLDFDWMVTQLCPVDLLFQRLGRLHRRQRQRPAGLAQPRCTVLTPPGNDFGLHQIIYGDPLVLWRTRELLRRTETAEFPAAYRDWIEPVYDEAAWPDEPEAVRADHEGFLQEQEASRYLALRLARADTVPLADTEGNVRVLTRDSEMSLSVVPVVQTAAGTALLDGDLLDSLSENGRAEALSRNTIPVPDSWRNALPGPRDGELLLAMIAADADVWVAVCGDTTLSYSKQNGLEKSP